MRLLFSASLLLFVLTSAPAAADEPARLAQTMGVDLRRLDPARKSVGRSVALFSRATYPVMPHVRGGVEVGAGWAHLRGAAPKPGAARLEDEGVFYYGGMLFGLAFAAGPVSVGTEVVAGARAVDTAVAAMLEPRLKAEILLRSDLTIGARLGSELLHDDELVGGLYASLFTW